MAGSSTSRTPGDSSFTTLGIWILLLVNSIIPIVHAQSLASVAAKHPELSTFFSLLNQSSSVTQQLSTGKYTVFAPTNDAWNATGNSGLFISNERDPLLHYHIVGTPYSSTQLQQAAPAILETLLTDANYTILSGGQAVEVFNNNGQVQVMSGVYSNSSIVTPDITFDNGVIHTVSKVFNIPASVGTNLVYARLSGFIEFGDILANGDLQNLQYINTLQQNQDVTVFAPNDTKYITNNTLLQDLSETDALALLEYHVIVSKRLYIPDLKNGQTFTTFAGKNVTIWIVNGTTYINDSPVIMGDLFAKNGVVQVLQKPLNINDTSAAPPGAVGAPKGSSGGSSTSGSSTSSSSSTGIGVGVGVGVGVVVLLLIAGWFFLRRRKQRSKRTSAEPILEDNAMELEGAQRNELDDASRNEIGGIPRSELDSKKDYKDPREWRVSGAFEMHDPSTVRERGEMPAEDVVSVPIKQEVTQEVHEMP